MNLSIKIIAIVFLISSGCQPKKDDSFAGKIRLTELNGQKIDLSSYRGKTVFINVWATWCKPCIEEMPSISEAKSILKDKNIEFLFASDESEDRIESFASKRQLDLHYVRLENMEELQIMALPTTYVLNAEGEVEFSESGYRKWDDKSNIELLTKIIEDNE